MGSSGGAKRVTLARVAELAGVSVMTASYAYNRPDRVSDQARSKVLAAAGQLGYPGTDPRARSLRRGSTRTLGVVLGEHLSYAFDDPGAVAFLAGIADVCAARGYGMTILPITGAADDVPRITDAAVDGFMSGPPPTTTRSWPPSRRGGGPRSSTAGRRSPGWDW